MADALNVESESAGNRNARAQKPDEGEAQDIEEDQRVPISSSGVEAEKVRTAKKPEEEPKPSKLKEFWGKLGLDPGTLMMMFKWVSNIIALPMYNADIPNRGSLAPTIAVAWYQSTDIADIYSSLGYLVPIITVLSLALTPRAKYIQTLILNMVGICIGSAMSLLGIWSSIQARKHTTPAGSEALYNSSQAAICAIWLFANIYVVNVTRAKMPALQFPVVMYSIFTNVSFTYGPIFLTMAQAEALIKELLTAFLTAFAIATGVSLFILPISSRTVVQREQAGYLQGARAALKVRVCLFVTRSTKD